MTEATGSRSGWAALMGIAASMVIATGLRSAQSIVVPLLFAAFLSVICLPLLRWLRSKGLPQGLAVSAVLVSVLVGLLFVAGLVGPSIQAFSERLPFYQGQLDDQLQSLGSALGRPVTLANVVNTAPPSAAMGFAASVLNSLGSSVGNLFLIAFTVIFVLVEADSFPKKLASAIGDTRSTFEAFDRFVAHLQSYLAIKALISFITGLLVTILTALLGVDFPVLWGVLAFLLNFVPNIGSFLAAVPAVMVALVQLGPLSAGFVAAGYVVINVALGSVLEPRLMGRNLGLSVLVVFLSLVFWGWIFGPVGMLLAVPLTMTTKIAFESHPDTAWIGGLLGSGDPTSSRRSTHDTTQTAPSTGDAAAV